MITEFYKNIYIPSSHKKDNGSQNDVEIKIDHPAFPVKKEPEKIGKADYHDHSGCTLNYHVDK